MRAEYRISIRTMGVTPQTIVADSKLHQLGEIVRQGHHAPPRRGVGDEWCAGAQQFVGVHLFSWWLLAAVQLLDALQRVAIEPIRTAQALGELGQERDTWVLVERRCFSGFSTC